MVIEHRVADITRDLSDIADIHIKAFPGFFLTAMGKSFVREYYRAVLEFPENLCFVATEEERTVGFVVGFGNPPAFYTFYKKRRVRLISLVLRAILTNPGLLGRVLVNLKRVSSVEGSSSEVELSSVGVEPSLTGTGVGRSLIQAFVNLARERGYQSIYLTTDAEENDRVNLFYIKQGFILERTFLSGSRKMNQYRLLL